MKSENRFKRPRRSGRTLSLLLTAVMIISSVVFSMQAQAAGQPESAGQPVAAGQPQAAGQAQAAGQPQAAGQSKAAGQDKAAVQAYAENESLFRTADISPADRPDAAWTGLRNGINMKDAARKVSGGKEARPTGGLAESRILRIKDDPAAEVHDDAADFAASDTAPVRADGEEYKLNFSRGNTMEGYEQQLMDPKADARRELYMMILKEASEFEQNKETAQKRDSYYYFTAFKYDQFGLNQTDVFEVYKAFMMDHPSCYWIEVSTCMLYDYNYCYLLVNKEFRTPRQRSLANKAIKERLAEYKALTTGLTTNYEKELAIHDKILNDVEYNYNDLSGVYSQSILGVMDANSGLTVCAGYAKAFSFLLRYYGVPNYYVEGYANGGKHAWNLVQLDDGKWYWNDATWDDGLYGAPYFNCPNRYFIKDHKANDFECDRYDYSYNLPAPAGKTDFSHPAIIEKSWIYKGHTYALYNTSLIWDEAEAACEAAGGTLAVITSAGEQNYVSKKLNGEYALLGGIYDAASDKWSWVNGQGWKKTFFSPDAWLPDETFCRLAMNWDNSWQVVTADSRDYSLLCEWNEEKELTDLPEILTGYNPGYYYAGGMNLKKAKLTMLGDTAEYCSMETFPSFEVKYGKNELWYNNGIIWLTKNSANAGTGTLVIQGIQGYTGTITQDFTVTRKPLTQYGITVHKLKDRTYTGKALKPVIRLDDNGWKLSYGVDYTLKWSNNIEPGKATITITGKGNYKGTIKATFKIVKN